MIVAIVAIRVDPVTPVSVSGRPARMRDALRMTDEISSVVASCVIRSPSAKEHVPVSTLLHANTTQDGLPRP